MSRIGFVNIRCTENLPRDGKGSRLWRSGLLSKYIYENTNYELSWIISTFDHYHKHNRSHEEMSSYESSLFRNIIMLKTPGYTNNISPQRFLDHSIFGFKLFVYLVKNRKKSEVLYCSYPTIESSVVTVLFSILFGKTSIIDIRDKWPDVMAERFNGRLQTIAKLILFPYYISRLFILKYADSVIAANSDYLDWAKYIGGRFEQNDCVFRIGFAKPSHSEMNKKKNLEYLRNINTKGRLIVTYGGTIGKMFDFKTIRQVLDDHRIKDNFFFLFYGDGDEFKETKLMFEGVENVHFAGRVDSNYLFEALYNSDILLAPYIKSSNFTNHLPNKIAEYLAAEKPILTSLEGVAGKLLEDYDVGWIYRNSNELKDKLKMIITDIDLEKKSNKAAILFENTFQADAINKNIVKHCENVFSSKIKR